MDNLEIKAKIRFLRGRENDAIRSERIVPAVVYGNKVEPKLIQVDRHELATVYKEAGKSGLVNLSVDLEKPVKVLIQELQYNPISDELSHADFFQVNEKEPIHTEIKLNFVGVPPAVKELGGTLVMNMISVPVKALPNDLVRSIEVDLSSLKTFEDVICVRDIKLPHGIELEIDGAASVSVVTAPRSEAEMAALEGAVEADVSKVEVVGAKKEGEEGEEGTDAGASKAGEAEEKEK